MALGMAYLNRAIEKNALKVGNIKQGNISVTQVRQQEPICLVDLDSHTSMRDA